MDNFYTNKKAKEIDIVDNLFSNLLKLKRWVKLLVGYLSIYFIAKLEEKLGQ